MKMIWAGSLKKFMPSSFISRHWASPEPRPTMLMALIRLPTRSWIVLMSVRLASTQKLPPKAVVR